MLLQLEQINQVMAQADCLYEQAEVEQAISRVASEINAQLSKTNPLVFCVMNGGLIFAGKLLTQLDFPLQQSYLHATRYCNQTSGGALFWKAKPETELAGRTVLVVDDILDEGHTLHEILDYCRKAGAASIHTAVLLNKQHQRKARPEFTADFVGLQCPDRYVFGYGMDYQGYWRNAAGIYAVKGM